MEIKLDKRFAKNVKGLFGKYQFEVGVLEDSPHRDALKGKPGLKGADVITTYAGGPVRKASRKSSGKSVAEVSASLRKHLGYNYLTKPFEDKSSDIVKFSQEFFKLVFGKSQKKRCENLLQAIVRNPILRGEVGKQSPVTTIIKGFDRPSIDTAQLFKSITARVITKGRK